MQATTRRGHRGTSTHCAQPAGPHTQPLQVQRDADRAAALPRTAQACPSGHLNTGSLNTGRPDTGRPDTGHLETGHRTLDVGRPLDGLDGRPTAGPGRGQGNDQPGRRPDILAPATPAGRPDLTRVTALGVLGHPGRPRGDGTCAGALTAAATDSCPAPPGMRPRPGALLSSDDFGLRVERAAKRHPLWRAAVTETGVKRLATVGGWWA
jgi:hypothetical protein